MPDELTLLALETLSDLKRKGIIPSVRPCCGHEHCQCEGAPRPQSVSDFMPLRVLTMEGDIGLHEPPCDNTHTCQCPSCEQARSKAVKLGSRDRAQPWHSRPVRRAA